MPISFSARPNSTAKNGGTGRKEPRQVWRRWVRAFPRVGKKVWRAANGAITHQKQTFHRTIALSFLSYRNHMVLFATRSASVKEIVMIYIASLYIASSFPNIHPSDTTTIANTPPFFPVMSCVFLPPLFFLPSLRQPYQPLSPYLAYEL